MIALVFDTVTKSLVLTHLKCIYFYYYYILNSTTYRFLDKSTVFFCININNNIIISLPPPWLNDEGYAELDLSMRLSVSLPVQNP